MAGSVIMKQSILYLMNIRSKTKSLAVARIADRTGCQWFSRPSNVDNFYDVWKPICHFLLVISSDFCPTAHRFRDMASFSLKNAHLYLFLFNPNFKNVSFALDR